MPFRTKCSHWLPNHHPFLRPLGRTENIMDAVLDLLGLLIYSRKGLDNSIVTIEVYGFCDYFVLKL